MKFVGGLKGEHVPETRDVAGLYNAVAMGEFKKIGKPNQKNYLDFDPSRGGRKSRGRNRKPHLNFAAIHRSLDYRLNRR